MDPLGEVLKDRFEKVAERDRLRAFVNDQERMLKEAAKGGSVAGALTGSAFELFSKAWPWLAVGLPAIAGTGTGYAIAKMQSPTKDDLERVAERVLSGKKTLAKKELSELVRELGPEILDSPDEKERRGVRLG